MGTGDCSGNVLRGEQLFEKFGFSVNLAATGEILAVGAPFRDIVDKGVNEEGRHEFEFGGVVQVYKYLHGEWNMMGKPIPYRNQAERAGWSVALSNNGNVIAVSAPTNNDKGGDASGQVRVYEFDFESQDWVIRELPFKAKI